MVERAAEAQFELLISAEPGAPSASASVPVPVPAIHPRVVRSDANAHPAELARELWLALHWPTLAFEALQDEFTSAAPRVVLDSAERHARVLLTDERAARLGIRPGLTLAAALALAVELETRVRNTARERAWLERAAVLALGFTSRVSLEPPDALLLEVRGSVRLFGGLESLCQRIETECQALQMHPVCAVAPTALGALAGARAGRALRITSRSRLPGALAPLPLTVLRWDEDTLARLASIGVRTVAEALRLPRSGLARRFGAARLTTLDQLTGRRPDIRRGFLAAERFRGRFEPDHELESLQAVLTTLEPLLAELEQFLETRQCGVTVIRCRLRHRGRSPTSCVLRLAAPEARAAQFINLLRERLGTLTLPAPVRSCEVRTGPLLARPLTSLGLWQPGEYGGDEGHRDRLAFIEQLRARLGHDGVYSPGMGADHRPERIGRAVEPLATAASASASASAGAAAALLPWSAPRRPLWLLAAPRPLEEIRGMPRSDGVLELVQGPERIETGWWDGADIERDYYVARNPRGAWLWIFRERTAPHTWFLHGLFG